MTQQPKRIEFEDRVEYRLNDVLHREDGPAVEYADGNKFWYKNGQLHREDGPAIEYADGTKKWYKNGQLHREDGPAAEYKNGTKAWYLNKKLHREDGPSIEYANGDKSWYLNGEQLTKEEFKKRTKSYPTARCYSRKEKKMFVYYSGVDEVIVTTPENESETIQKWFIEGGRNLSEYDREEIMDPAVEIRARAVLG